MVNPIISWAYSTISIMFVWLIMMTIVSIEEKARYIQMINDVPERVASKYCENYQELSWSWRIWCENNNFWSDGFTDRKAITLDMSE